jgi:biopolymer transport protein ExbB
VTTAAGLTVAIPSLLFYRYFQRRIDELVVDMEQETLELIDLLDTQTIVATQAEAERQP